MKITKIYLILICLILISCEKDTIHFNPSEHIYFNSFEQSTDTIGWEGIGLGNIKEDAPESGGKYSLFVSGGCIIPHVVYKFATVQEECYVVLKCWGKNLSNGGGINLHAVNGSGGLSISISDTNWTSYVSKDTLLSPADGILELNLIAGGIFGSSMLVDLIEIVKVDKE